MTTALTRQDGTLREDGALVVSRIEKPNGWVEIKKVGKLKVRGEKEPRTINYADYAKLITFYTGQARMVKDRKHIMVALSGGKFINTADITSLELEDQEDFIRKKPEAPKDVENLPTEWTRSADDGTDRYFECLCHFTTNPDGTKNYIQDLDKVPEARVMRKDEYGRPVIVQVYKYGIPQL